MTLKEIMDFKSFAVIGNTLDEEKYAYIIKHKLIEYGYKVYPVYKEYKSLNDIEDEIDVIIMVINQYKGLEILKSSNKKVKVILIQPGAEGDELLDYLDKNKINYIEGCILVGLSLFKNK